MNAYEPLETIATVASLLILAFGVGLLSYGIWHYDTEAGDVGTILGALLCMLSVPRLWKWLKRTR